MYLEKVKSRTPSFLLNAYRQSSCLQWLRSLTLRHHWREIHTRDSCIYGNSLRPFLFDLLWRLVGARPCDGHTLEHCESTLASLLGVTHLATFRSGRNSLRAILMAMGIGDGDEVILPGFTCAVVPYTIVQCGAKPVYVDIRSDYRMNLEALRSSLTERTKAIIAQHTFGLPERLPEILALARSRGIRVIEDCAHVLPGSAYDGKPLGTWGDAAYFSFERGKTISSSWGGAAVTSEEEIGRALSQIQAGVPHFNRNAHLKVGVQLLLILLLHHPKLFALLSLIRASMARRGVVPNAVPPGECRGDPPNPILGRLTDTQAALLLVQIKRLSSISEQRRSCVRALATRLGGTPVDLPLMWYPLQVANAAEAVEHFAAHQIELRRWEAPLTPAGCDTARAGYRWGSCPEAENISRGCVALPTMLSKSDLERVVETASRYLEITGIP